MKLRQKLLIFEDVVPQKKKMNKGRADFHKLGQLLQTQLEKERKRKIRYTH